MKFNIKKILAIAVSFCLLAGVLAGCGSSSESASAYVKAILGIVYMSDAIDNKLLDMDMDEVEKARKQSLEQEAKFLAEYFNMEEISDKSKTAFEETAQKIEEKANYNVTEGDNNKVTVTIKPLIVYSDKLQEFVDDFNVKKFVDADKSYTEDKFVEGVVKILEETVSEGKYADEVTIEIEVKKDGNKFLISDEDLEKIDSAMFKYE